MGRPEKPVDGSAPPFLAALVTALRAQRLTTGLTYEQLAQDVTVSAATLKRAASGASVPRFETVQQFFIACRPHLPREQLMPTWRDTLLSWQLARMEERRTLYAKTIRLDLIADARDLSRALELFWEKKGAPSATLIIKQSKDEIVIPRSSLQRILRREAFPQSQRQLMAIVRGCLSTPLEEKKWEAAWKKVRRLS